MAERDLPHLFLQNWGATEGFTAHRGGGGGTPVPERDRGKHSAHLRAALDAAIDDGRDRRAAAADAVGMEASGIYVEFESFPELGLALESLENRRLAMPAELRAVRKVERDGAVVEMATVFMPDAAVTAFLRKLESYATEDTPTGAPKNRKLVDSLADIRLATLEALWTEDDLPFPDGRVWWEVWLRRGGTDPEGEPELEEFLRFADRANVTVGDQRLAFPDRTVLLAQASAQQLASATDALDHLAELRAPPQPVEFFERLQPAEQAEWIEDLLTRLDVPARDADPPAVSVLDTGVRQAHPLLEPFLDAVDLHTVVEEWGTADNHGHGTEMAGLALYGDSLARMLEETDRFAVRHVLESVKIFRGPHDNDPRLYGAVTAEAASRVEITAPARRRAFSLAITADPPPGTTGQPTSWSAAIDALAVGHTPIPVEDGGLVYLDEADPEATRVFVVAAGNVRREDWIREHLARSDADPILDPGQAWNALTVGALTELTDPGAHVGGVAVAAAGELSPHSRTSVPFAREWAVKPDICLEGGNLAEGPPGEFDTPVSMQLLTTHGAAAGRLLTVSNATSAATAQGARLAAALWAEYPDLWPETVRALIVHAARWTPAMAAHLNDARTKADVENLVRRYGMGVPTLERAMRSAANDLVLVAQEVTHPFADGATREMQLFELPWPVEQLEELGDTPVRLRVALSYFVQPNPSRRGWRGRFRYASHGLRFDVKRATETLPTFRKRINGQALGGQEARPTGAGTDDWLIGSRNRGRGSLHADLWQGTAADLAARGVVAVYPVTGWWKELPARDRSDLGCRYALVMSIEVPEVEIDLWTPVHQQIQAAVTVATET